MLGAREGFVAKTVKEQNPELIVVYSLPSTQWNLAFCQISSNSAIVMKDKKTKPLNVKIFKKISHEFKSHNIPLLYHSNVRWLSCEKVLQRLIKLHVQVQQSLTEQNDQLAQKFSDIRWFTKISLADIFVELNCLNTTMQWHNQTVSVCEKLVAIKKKLILWKSKVEANRTAQFF